MCILFVLLKILLMVRVAANFEFDTSCLVYRIRVHLGDMDCEMRFAISTQPNTWECNICSHANTNIAMSQFTHVVYAS